MAHVFQEMAMQIEIYVYIREELEDIDNNAR